MTTMLSELALSTLLVLATVLLHALGLSLLSQLLRVESRHERHVHPNPLTAQGIGFTLVLVIGLFTLHGAEIWLYGLAYLALDAIGDLRTALYFSTITYATLGYDDLAIADRWKLVAAIEGVNGVLLMGWSTAYFVTVVTRLDR